MATPERTRQTATALLAALFLIPGIVMAQDTGVVSGYVRADGSNTPVAGARIQLVTTNEVVESDETGYFVFTTVPPGVHTIVVQAIGYQPSLNGSAEALAATLTTVDFTLRSTAYELDPVEIVGEPDAREEPTGAVTVLTGDELPQEGDIILGLPGRVPGINLSYSSGQVRSIAQTDGVTVTGRNGRPVMWVLDGVPYEGTLSFHVDASDVDCVEIRRGNEAALEFARGIVSNASGNIGGVIIIWTKSGNARRRTGACARQDNR